MKTVHLNRKDQAEARKLTRWFKATYPLSQVEDWRINSDELRDRLINETSLQVLRGAKALDKTLGKDWPLLVNLRTFDINSGTRCVLGQVMNTTAGDDYFYDEGVEALSVVIDVNGTVQDAAYAEVFTFLTDFDKGLNWSVRHGFSSYLDTVSNPMWKKFIEDRQASYTSSYKRRFRAAVRKLRKEEAV